MSLVLAGIVFAGTSGALMLGRWIARRMGRPEDEDAAERKDTPNDAPPPVKEKGEERVEPRKPARKIEVRDEKDAPRLDGFVCQLGDVLMRITGEEAWLAGGVVLSEEIPVAVLFVAPDAGHDCVIYVRARPSGSSHRREPLGRART